MDAWKPDIQCKRKNHDGYYVYDHEGVLVGKIKKYSDNYRDLYQLYGYNQEEGCFYEYAGLVKGFKNALNEFRALYNYEVEEP